MPSSGNVAKFRLVDFYLLIIFSAFPCTVSALSTTAPVGPCGKTSHTLKDEPISITSPNYPDDYSRNDDCQWLIETEPGIRISVEFVDFVTDLIGDFLNAGNGLTPNRATTVILNHGGNSLPENFITRDNQMWMTFSSDFSAQFKGFEVVLRQTNETTCEEDFYECLNGVCIPDDYICDGISDCDSGEDEDEDCPPIDPCGEGHVVLLDDQPVLIRSPFYPREYPNSFNCEWTVETRNEETNVRVHFKDFQTMDGDFISAGNGLDPTEQSTTIIDRYSAGPPPPDFISRDNTVWITFTTNTAGSAKGFEAELTSTNESNCIVDEYECSNSFCISSSLLCNGQNDCISGEDETNFCPGFFNYTLSDEGDFSSPYYPNRTYTPDIEAHWLLEASAGKNVRLSFQSFELQSDFFSVDPEKSCPNRYDTVMVYDGPSESSDLIAVFCGSKLPPVTHSSGDKMLVVLKSDSYIEEAGFLATFSSTDEDPTGYPIIECGESQFVDDEYPVVVRSPNYPGPYNNSLQCLWELEARPDYRFLAKFLDFSTETGRDFVLVGNGKFSLNGTDQVINSHSGSNLPVPSEILTSGNLMWITFMADYSNNDRGFEVEILRVDDSYGRTTMSPGPCGKLHYFLEENGVVVLTSPNFPSDYGNFLDCSWLVESSGSNVLVNFTNFNTDNGDVLNAGHGLDPSDTDSVVIENFSGSQLPNDFIATSNGVWVTFTSDRTRAASGFRIEFTQTNLTSLICPPGEIECKTYMNCIPSIWICDGRADCPLKDDEIGCENITLPDSRNHTLTTEGELSSPYWPKRTYLPDTSVRWLLDTLDAQLHVHLQFYAFSLQDDIVVTDPKKSCPNNYDTVKIYDGPSSVDSPLLGAFCGSKRPPPVRSTGQFMYVVFSSDDFIEDRGFHAHFKSSAEDVPRTTASPRTPNCGSPEPLFLNGSETLEITSPNYPENYFDGARCVWMINTMIGDRIKMEVTDFHSELGRDFLAAGNGSGLMDPVISHSGQTLPDPASFVSTGNYVWITFMSDYSVNDTGFRSILRVACKSGEYECSSNGVCIPEDYVCDGRGDCPLSDDEIGCPTVPGKMNYTLNVRGNLKTPYWPDRTYLPNTEIQWQLRAPGGLHVRLDFVDFHLQKDIILPDPLESCPNDFDTVKIYDGQSTASPTLGVFCGSEIPPHIISTGQNMLVVFKSDNFIEETGFYANFTSTEEEGPIFPTMGIPSPNCGARLTIDAEPQVNFTTPNYPDIYPNGLRCLWLVETQSNFRIDVQFTNFSSEKGHDIMSVGNGVDAANNTVISQHSGPGLPPRFVTFGNTLWTSFISDYSVGDQGFQVILTRTNASAYLPSTESPNPEDCTKSILLDGESDATFSSPNYPGRYSNNLDCQWTITTTSKDLQIYLSFNDFNTELSFDILRAGNGLDPTNQSTLVVHHSGNTLPRGFTSEANSVWVTFFSDENIRATGFEISVSSYKAICMDGDFDCGNGQCVPESAVCNKTDDCGNNFDEAGCIYPTTTKSPFECAIDEYKCLGVDVCISQDWVCDGRPDCYAKDDEFSCSDIPTFSNQTILDSGTFTTPYYPRTYPANLVLYWVLEAKENQRCQLTFPDFQLQRDIVLTCPNDYDTVTIYDGETTDSSVIGVYCGSLIPDQITSSGRYLLVVFKSDNYVEEAGFSAEFSSEFIKDPTDKPEATESPVEVGEQGAAAVEAWTWVVVCIAIVAVIACVALVGYIFSGNKNKGTSSDENLNTYNNASYENADPVQKESNKTTHL